MIVLECLTIVGFMMNLAKCDFLESKVKMVAYMLGNELVKPCHSL